MALKDDFIRGRALRSITAAWLNGVARALNSLTIKFDKNAVSPRIEKPPVPIGRAAWTIVLPPYPDGGSGGGGESEPTLVLGPMEYDEAAGKVVQYAGEWIYNSDAGSWTFAKATDSSGKTLPAAHTYNAAVAKILVREQDSSVDTIATIQAPVIFPSNLGAWLHRHTANVTRSVDYIPPTSELGEGKLGTVDSKITYFEAAGNVQVDVEDRVLLTTITEDAQTDSTYEGVE